MKKLLNLLALLLLPFCMTMAQEKNGFYVDFGAGFSNELEFNFAQLTPGVGYKFSPQWAVGFRTTVQTTDSSPEALVYTPYVSYTFLQFGKLGIGTDGMVSFATKKANCDDTMDLNYKPYRPLCQRPQPRLPHEWHQTDKLSHSSRHRGSRTSRFLHLLPASVR